MRLLCVFKNEMRELRISQIGEWRAHIRTYTEITNEIISFIGNQTFLIKIFKYK